jgi:hypothetical protein
METFKPTKRTRQTKRVDYTISITNISRIEEYCKFYGIPKSTFVNSLITYFFEQININS